MLSQEQFRTLCKSWVRAFPPDGILIASSPGALGLSAPWSESRDGIIRFNLWEFDSGDAMLAYELTIIEGTQEDTTYGVEPITDSTHNELALDGDTVHPSAATSVWRGQLSIALHHTYQVPSLYISLCNERGERATPDILMRLLNSRSGGDIKQESNNEKQQEQQQLLQDGEGDNSRPNSTYASLEDTAGDMMWMEEEHPLTGQPALTLHVCGVPERMDLLQLQQQPKPYDTISNTRGEKRSDHNEGAREPPESSCTASAYLLLWLALVRHSVGISISAIAFETMRKRLLELDC